LINELRIHIILRMSTILQQKSFNPIWSPIATNEQAWRENMGLRNLVVEIGPGVGLHPIQYAKQHPQDYIVAIEKTSAKYDKFARRVEHHPQLDNIYAVHANAIEWITRNIKADEVSQYFLLYPNPYPKESQKNKRLMHMPFMQYLVATMQVGATITLATNMEFFYLEAKQQWEAISCFSLVQDLRLQQNIDLKPRTHFERKYLAAGQTCFQLVFAKKY
jgi:tRNA (guanine-N7-)-methyltransferase